ncbi:ABC transporter permease subunit [Anaerobacillus isosaccharinicus]|uniref:ABC transporter permease subunit n=1 Tax=Anaerobacillus isosaccharinicus TaxID=1532552 RepID=A0A1S2MHM1_9BACI|nr:ABC transporter permease subunit [Anaerobacillus isosaccharinicus]MBA5584193.1 ABC transporter permease subunit [Anaerobacillus isosaccharinicus]QOY37403.1 ABC transporter permease subunit [Anaerobacillus isosaccharinicus]
MLIRSLLKTLFMYAIVMGLLILIVLFPRNSEMILVDGVMTYQYKFTWQNYFENIRLYFTNLVETKSLGETQSWQTVEEVIISFMPASLKVVFAAFFISLFFGVYKGIVDFQHSNRKTNFLGNGTTFLFQAIPDFFLIILMILFIINYLPFIPIFSQGQWYSFIIPAIIVAIYPSMYIARITSAAMTNEDGMQYIQVAKAKGLTDKMVIYKHVLRNCYGLILSHCSSVMLLILSNLLMVEFLMGYRGAAFRLFQALDYSNVMSVGQRSKFEAELIIGISFCFLVIVLFSRFVSEWASNYLDPRRKEQL